MVCADSSPDIPYLGILGGGFGVERKEIKGTLKKLNPSVRHGRNSLSGHREGYVL